MYNLNIKDLEQVSFQATPDFWNSLEAILSKSYLNQYGLTEIQELDFNNYRSVLYGYYKILQNSQGKSQKKLLFQLQKLDDCKLSKKNHKTNKNLAEKLKKQQQHLKNIVVSNTVTNDQVSRQIYQLERQLAQINKDNKYIFSKLKNRVTKQLNYQEFIYCINNQQDQDQIDAIMNSQGEIRYVNYLNHINKVDYQLNYLKYLILALQKKQVAESISKIVRLERSRNQNRFAIAFESGMNLKMKLMTQQQLVSYNLLRQYSLLKFYNTSLKTPYSFICQNVRFDSIQYLGFREICSQRNRQSKLKTKDVFELMKKTGYQPYDQTAKTFSTFEICHHCKLLYPPEFLQNCKYSSVRSGAPSMPSSHCNPYLMQISKIQGAATQRFSTRRRNFLFGYSKIDNEYCCQRKFCKYCLKHSYPDGMDKNGLCPFCQGICFCTRCSRNQTIIKLKSMYHLYGGNILQLLRISQLEKLQQMDGEQEIQSKKKGRPKKIFKRINNRFIMIKNQNKLNNLRYGLEDVRMLCDMVKKRQKKKYKVNQGSTQLFQNKIPLVAKDYDWKRTFSKMDWKENQDPQVLQMQKPKKKLHH